jgi:uncharacterized repeat protein (TIGR01451 family)
MTQEGGNVVRTIRILTLAVVLLAGAAATAVADAPGGVELRATAEIEVPVTGDDGSVAVHREPAVKVVPGNEVVYTMHYRNASVDAAEDVVITNPLPVHMTLMRTGGLPPEVSLTFSVDGGRTFGALARLQVPGPDGQPRPATAADCTHLRWNFTRPLAPGETGSVDYVAQLQ